MRFSISSALLALTVALALSCSADSLPWPPRASGAWAVGLAATRLSAAAGDTVTVSVTLTAGTASDGVLGALQARLSYDAGTLRYVGQDPAIGAPTVTNPEPGRLRFASLDSHGLPARAASFAFLALRSIPHL